MVLSLRGVRAAAGRREFPGRAGLTTRSCPYYRGFSSIACVATLVVPRHVAELRLDSSTRRTSRRSPAFRRVRVFGGRCIRPLPAECPERAGSVGEPPVPVALGPGRGVSTIASDAEGSDDGRCVDVLVGVDAERDLRGGPGRAMPGASTATASRRPTGQSQGARPVTSHRPGTPATPSG